MRKGIIFAAMATLLFCCNSCLGEGLWTPIKMDKTEVHFTSDGGEDIVTATNYSSWWINYGYEDAHNVNGKVEYVGFVYATSTDGAYTYDILDGGWYHAIVANKGQSNILVITVDQDYSAKPRQATINMEAGDAFTTVKIFQN